MILSGWQGSVLLAVVVISIGIILYSLRNLQRMNGLRHPQVHVQWLYVLCAALVLIYLYYIYYLSTNEFGLIQAFVAVSFLLVALFVWILTDLTYGISIDLTKAAAVEHYHATHDELTGLPNLAFFNEQLEPILDDALENEYEVALLLIDLNRFQLINETIGYFGGDIMLQEISQRIRGALRKTDLISRVGGDEFAVLINPVIARGHLHTIANNIADSIQEPLSVDDKPTDVGVSIGVSVFPTHAKTILELIDTARIAMLKAKQSGAPILVFDPSTLSDAAEDIQIIGMLQRAIREQQLTVLYQPQIRLDDMSLVSVEALIRWNHPDYGILDPSKFIPYAERAGLIYEINLWLIEEIEKVLMQWNKQSIHLLIAVNVTVNGFLNKNFQQTLDSILKTSPWIAEMLKIELTETSTIENASEITSSIKKYRKAGLIFSLDDYGTRRASLEYLKKLPFDEVKIDHSFMMNAISDKDSKAIILHAREIAHQLNLSITAEGIENKEILSLAKECKFDYGQGYYFSPAVSAQNIESFVKQHGMDAKAYLNAK